MSHLGKVLAHLLEIVFAVPRVVAVFNSGTLFHTLAIILQASVGYPGTGIGISLQVADLVCLELSLS